MRFNAEKVIPSFVMLRITPTGKAGGKRKSAAKLNKEYELYEVSNHYSTLTYF